jgi:hypothetical protein
MPTKHKTNNMVSIRTLFPLKKFSTVHNDLSMARGGRGEIGVTKTWSTHGGGPMGPQLCHQNRLLSPF